MWAVQGPPGPQGDSKGSPATWQQLKSTGSYSCRQTVDGYWRFFTLPSYRNIKKYIHNDDKMSSFTVNPSSCGISWDYWHTEIMTTCICDCKIAQWDRLFITGKKRKESEGQRVKSCWHAVDSFMSDVVLTSQWDSCVYAADSFSLVSTRGKYLWTWCSHGTDHFLGDFWLKRFETKESFELQWHFFLANFRTE